MIKYEILIGLTTNTGLKLKAKQVINKVAETIPAFSVTKTTGYWQGKKEKSLCITLLFIEQKTVHELAKVLQTEFIQDSVYVTETEINTIDIH